MERPTTFQPLPVVRVHPANQAEPREESNDPDHSGAVDPRQLQVHRPVPHRDVPYLPTDHPIVTALLDLAELTPDDVLYDLGCGDGRIVIEAAKRGARAVGVDIDFTRLRECHENLRKSGAG